MAFSTEILHTPESSVVCYIYRTDRVTTTNRSLALIILFYSDGKSVGVNKLCI